jgi:hypothetical protein
MIEDKLTADQRLRLECLAQAVQHEGISHRQSSPEVVVETAGRFATFVRGEGND